MNTLMSKVFERQLFAAPFATSSTPHKGMELVDLEEAIGDLKSHGYSSENGTTLFFLVNTAEANVIRTFRANQVNQNGKTALYDFVPATNQPALIVPNEAGLLGSQPGPTFRGLNVIGAYGNALIIEEDYIPAGYVVLLGSGGEGNLNNPIGFREHQTSGLRGLRLVKGRDNDYPLIDSYYARGFGTGIRQRGAGLVMQVKASGSYAPPAAYTA